MPNGRLSFEMGLYPRIAAMKGGPDAELEIRH